MSIRRGILLRGAVAVATALAGTVVAGGVTAAPAYAAAPRCNTAGFIPYIHGGGGQLDVPLYSSGGSSTLLCVMSSGDRGSDVNQLQWTLNYCYGEHLALDSDFGSLTKAALIRAQRREGIAADGIYGPETALHTLHPWVPNGGCRRA